MKKILFLFVACCLLAGCEEHTFPSDDWINTETFDTLTIGDGPHVFADQYVKDKDIVYNRWEVKVDEWTYFHGDIVVDMPVYVFYFVSSQEKLDYIPSKTYTTSLLGDQPWAIRRATQEMYRMNLGTKNVELLSSALLERCCIKVDYISRDKYDIQIWMEMNTLPYFRYIHLENKTIAFDRGGHSFVCEWWTRYFN